VLVRGAKDDNQAQLLAAFSLLFLGTYISDRKQWWALIPGLHILAIAIGVFLAEMDLVAGYIVATIILAGVGLPFLLIYLTDRQHWWALIPGIIMGMIAVAVFFEGTGAIGGEAVGGLVVGGVSLAFFSIYFVDRQHWWALIPGSIMGIVAFFLLLATAAEYIWPVALILLGFFMLRGSLGGGRKERVATRPAAPSVEIEQISPGDQSQASPRKRLPTLEEQIEAALAEDGRDTETGK
jgi:hypothetical protein